MAYDILKDALKQFKTEFEKNPNFFVRESEIQGYIYNIISSKFQPVKFGFKGKKEKGSIAEEILKNPLTSLVHTGASSKSRKMIDLVIFENRQLTFFKRTNQDFGYWECDNPIDVAVEIKHQRGNRLSSIIKNLKQDYEKLVNKEFNINKRILLWVDNLNTINNIGDLDKIKEKISKKRDFELIYISKSFSNI